MSNPVIIIWIFVFFFFVCCWNFSHADLGSASLYDPPYTPTACHGSDASQFPSTNLFAAAGEEIWNNGSSCGCQYLVRCISAAVPNTCIPGQTIRVKIVDRAETSVSRPTREGVTIVLSNTAFGTIGNSPATSMNIEIQQV